MSSQKSRTARIGAISEMRLGLAYSTSDSGNIPMIRAGDLAQPIHWQDVKRTQVKLSEVSDFLLRDGDVLLARSGVGSVGRVQVVVNPPTAVFASYVIRIRPLQDWHGPYICYYLKSPAGREALKSRVQGAANVNLSSSRISTIEIPELELAEQREIASGLQEIETSYISADQKLRQAKSGIDEMRRRLYQSAVQSSDAGEDYSSWDTQELAAITDNFDRARVPLNSDARRQRPGSIPYYGASGIIDQIDDATHDGTFVLVSEDGNNLLTRKSSIAFVATGRFWANNHVHVLKTHSEILPEFLALQINGLDLTRILSGAAQPKLSQAALNSLVIRVPSLDVQRDLLRTATELENTFNQLQETNAVISNNLGSAWDEILSDAFHSPGAVVRPLSLVESLQWLEDVAPMLSSLVAKEASESVPFAEPSLDEIAEGDPQGNASGSNDFDGWLTVREVFNTQYGRPGPDELEEKIDEFYAWLKSGIRSGEIGITRAKDETYLRVGP